MRAGWIGAATAALTTATARAATEGGEASGGMPQLNPDSFASQIFWMAVSFLLLFLLVWKVAMPRVAGILEDRRNRIDSDLERAATLKQEAEETQAAYETAMAEGRAEAQAAIRKSMDEAAKRASDEHAKLGAKLADDIAAAEGRIAQARDAAMKEIEDVSAEATQAAAQTLVGLKIDKRTAKSAVSAAIKERG